MRRVEQLGELGLIRRLRESGAHLGTGIRTGIGDDTAVLEVSRDAVLLATTDLHGNILPIDYYTGKPDARGLCR